MHIDKMELQEDGSKNLREVLPNKNIIANKYIIIEEIGKGKFGIVYKGEHVKNKTQVAIKMEHKTTPCNTIKYEATILNYLYKNGCRVIPSVLWYGIYLDYKCLTMDYYDQTIDSYIQSIKAKYKGSPPYCYLTQVIKLIINMVGILSQIHKHQIIHRDIKPENFMIKNSEVHLIDFGIASAVDSCEIITNEPNRNTLIGSPKYISYFIHDGYEPTYRDDLISVGYCFLHFVIGSLPWANINENIVHQNVYSEIHILHEKNQARKIQKEWKNIEKIITILNKKYKVVESIKYEQIFANMYKYFTVCYSLQLGERPFYEGLCQVLQKNI